MRPLLLALLLFAPATATAQDALNQYPDVTIETPLTQAELKSVFSGKTHVGSYNFLSRNIETYNFEELTRADGSVNHLQGDRIDTGVWSVETDEICFDYDDPGLVTACFQIYQRGNCYYHHQVRAMGVETATFTARTVIKGQTPDCEPSYV